MADAPAPAPSSTVSNLKTGIAVASLVMGKDGVPWLLIAAVVASIATAGTIGVVALRDAEGSFRHQGEATAKLADLTAAIAERDALQKRLDAVQADTAAAITELQARHAARLAAIAAAAAAAPKIVKTCPVDVPRARVIK